MPKYLVNVTATTIVTFEQVEIDVAESAEQAKSLAESMAIDEELDADSSDTTYSTTVELVED